MKYAEGRSAKRRNLDAIRRREWARDYETGIDPSLPIWLRPEREGEGQSTPTLETRAITPAYEA